MSETVKTIYRVIKNRNFTQISNDILYDAKLSLKAKGLMCIMLSLPDTWDFHRDHLVTLSSDGKDSLKAGIKELQLAGHLSISNERDERGRIKQWIMEVHEIPTSVAVQEVCPEADFPQVDNPQVVNPPFSNTKPESKTKENNNKAVVVDEKIIRKALGLGIKEFELMYLIEANSREKVEFHLEALLKAKGVRSPIAWLTDALKHGYTQPEANTAVFAPSSHEVWDEAKYKRDCREREKLSDPNDWREKMLSSVLQK